MEKQVWCCGRRKAQGNFDSEEIEGGHAKEDLTPAFVV